MGTMTVAMAFRVVLGLAILGVAQANWVSRADAAITGNLQGVAFPDGGTSEGVVVGASGVNLRTTDQGASWISETALDVDLKAVAFPSAAIGYTVGDDGYIYSTIDSGTSWIKNLNSASSRWTFQPLRGVGFASTSVGCAGGLNVILCTTDGPDGTWTAATVVGFVYAVAMPSTTVGFAGGSSGALFTGTLAADGSSTWAQYTGTDGSTGNFQGIAATSVQLACAVGKSAALGTLIYVTEDGGTNWVAPTTTIPVSTGLFAVAFHSQSTATGFKGFAVGKAGVVLTTVDAISATMTWLADTGSPIISSLDLLALSYPNQYEAYAVGESGAIMHYDVTAHPTNSPSNAPTFTPTNSPSNAPTTHAPTHSGDTFAPTAHAPTHPGDTYAPSNAPTAALGDSSSSSGMSRGGIAGIIIACIILLVVIIAVIYYFCIYNKKQPGDETAQTASPVDVPPEMTMGSPKADAPPSPKSPASGLSSVHNAIHNAASRRGAVPNSPGSPPESADPDAVKVDFTIQG